MQKEEFEAEGGVYGAATLFFRPKMVLVRLLSRGFLSEVSFFIERPERTERASDVMLSS